MKDLIGDQGDLDNMPYYGLAEAKTTYGIIGVKVWICKGEVQKKKNKISE